MKLPPFEYHAPSTVDETLALLAEHGDDAKVLAGGQSVVPLLALRLARPEVLVDINGVHELATMNDADGVRIGAIVRERVVEQSSAALAANPLLTKALRFIGHPAIRNRGTIGGSIAHADPAAELPAVLVALDGDVEAASARGVRTVSATDLFRGFLTTALEPDELLTSVRFPRLLPGTGWSFQEYSRRSGDFAMAGVACALRVDAGVITEARIALSGVGDTPVRVTQGEAALVGHAPSESAWKAAAADGAGGLEPPSDIHASASYRRQLAAVLIQRALREAHVSTEERSAEGRA
jgi:carbon-monoxide dehydrogenase medium subunit